MQVTLFSTDDQKKGFRLQYMEVFNWGTFDEHVWRIEPKGETSLLTGANGSGKTTFVDALLTLLVPERRYRFYNQSSGSDKKGDRTEDSYVLGAYGTMPSGEGSALKTVYLREQKEAAYSILLANFENEAEQVVTLFQIRYFSGNDLKKVYGVAHKALKIETDFKPFDLNGAWKKRLEQQYNKGPRKQIEWMDSASRYAQRIVDVMGMQSIQALSLFNQTVGIKVLGDLNEFIRTNMLEPRNMEEQFQEIRKHLQTLLEAQQNIEKIEEQLNVLQPLKKHHEHWASMQGTLDETRNELQTATAWHRYTQFNFLDEAMKESARSIATLQQQLDQLKIAIQEGTEEERQTLNNIEQNKAGQRLHQLEQDKSKLSIDVQKAELERRKFVEWAETLSLKETEVSDEASFKRIKKEAERANLGLKNEKRENDEDIYVSRNTIRDTTNKIKEIEEELNIVHQHKNNIPSDQLNIRKEICQALKLETHELPFAGELLQVKAEDMDWQPALEKLLRSFSLRLLVPEKHYRRVNKYVNTTNLRGRLVYYSISDVALVQHPEEDTVYHKLEFNKDHKLHHWVKQQIIAQFDYVCVDDERALERYNKALTIHGLIKSRDRHEKDDRSNRNDPRYYVMGWNNERKKEVLQTKRLKLGQELDNAEEALKRAEAKEKRLQAKLVAVGRIAESEDFSIMNVTALQREIHKIEEQIKSLKESSDQLKVLTQQLESIREKLAKNVMLRDNTFRDLTLEDNRHKELERKKAELGPFMEMIGEKEVAEILAFSQKHHDLLSDLSISTLESIYQKIREGLDEFLRKQELQMAASQKELERGIMKIKNPSAEMLRKFPDWAADVQHLLEEVRYIGDYMEWLEKLEQENLPKYKKEFERLLHDTAVIKMGVLHEELDNWERKIKQSVQTLNQSLSGINFNRLPDTFIQLGIKPAADTTIKEFRANLLNALPQVADQHKQTLEEKAQHFRDHVQPLVQALEESESYRARVLDVRNWYEFWADEKFRNTDELKKSYRQMGQLSGGEKAQLTYTILCSAIAYQFGITRDGHNPRSLRFIAVDESFSNQDEEKATYLMELCKQLHLQLLVVTPSDKIQIVEDYIAHVHLVQRVQNRHSVLFNMTKLELKEKKGVISH